MCKTGRLCGRIGAFVSGKTRAQEWRVQKRTSRRSNRLVRVRKDTRRGSACAKTDKKSDWPHHLEGIRVALHGMRGVKRSGLIVHGLRRASRRQGQLTREARKVILLDVNDATTLLMDNEGLTATLPECRVRV